mgnify:CR=1 FL=1
MVVVVVSVSGAEVSVAGVELSSAGCEVVVFVSVETALLSVSTNTPSLTVVIIGNMLFLALW